MGKYLKMADVFPIEIKTDDESGSLICDEDGIILESFAGDKVADYTLHAINSHDELVENMQHYKQESEQWEVRATKEASRAQDFEAEVERLRLIATKLYHDGVNFIGAEDLDDEEDAAEMQGRFNDTLIEASAILGV